jgi:alpha-D-xyloside xylohydrolase
VKNAGDFHVLSAPLDTINIHLRAGAVIPMQNKALTTAAARKTPFSLLVVFSLGKDSFATGKLFLDDGESVEMRAQPERGTLVRFSAFQSSAGNGELNASVVAGEYALREGFVLQTVKILGLRSGLSSVRVNGVTLHPSLHIEQASDKEHLVELYPLSLPLGESFELSWECDQATA